MVVCGKDAICHPSFAYNLEQKNQNQNKFKLITYKNATHFDIYNGDLLNEAIQEEIKFLKQEFNLV